MKFTLANSRATASQDMSRDEMASSFALRAAMGASSRKYRREIRAKSYVS